MIKCWTYLIIHINYWLNYVYLGGCVDSNMLLVHACQQESCFEWKSCTLLCWTEKSGSQTWFALVNWIWHVSSVFPGGQPVLDWLTRGILPMVRLELATPGLQTQCSSHWAIQLKAIGGKELSLSSWCIASFYFYHFSTVIDFSSEKYSGSTGHRNSWYQ